MKANDQKDRICILTKYRPNYNRTRSEKLLGQIISVWRHFISYLAAWQWLWSCTTLNYELPFKVIIPLCSLIFINYNLLFKNFVVLIFRILQNKFYLTVTVLHRNKFLYNKTNQMHQFPKFTPAWKSTCFGQFLCSSSEVYSLIYVIQVWKQLSSRTIVVLLESCYKMYPPIPPSFEVFPQRWHWDFGSS
jgi:hypothetical protein